MFARSLSIASATAITRAFLSAPPLRTPSRRLAVRTNAGVHNGGQIKVAHILMPAEKKHELDALYERIVNETATLAELAKEHSACPSAQNGGIIGWIARGQTVEAFEDTAFSTPVGSVARCDTPFGSHVLEVLEVRETPKPHADASVEDLAEVLEAHAGDASAMNLIDVREQNEWDDSRIPAFTLKPLSGAREWATTMATEFDPTKPTYVLCAAGVRSARAASMLVDLGFQEVYNVTGGMYACAGVKGLVSR
jgi:rhodanese-related sulfurtransferase